MELSAAESSAELLGKQFWNDVPEHIRKTEVAALEGVGEAFVVEAE